MWQFLLSREQAKHFQIAIDNQINADTYVTTVEVRSRDQHPLSTATAGNRRSISNSEDDGGKQKQVTHTLSITRLLVFPVTRDNCIRILRKNIAVSLFASQRTTAMTASRPHFAFIICSNHRRLQCHSRKCVKLRLIYRKFAHHRRPKHVCAHGRNESTHLFLSSFWP